MKALLALAATVVLTACPYQPQSQSHPPAAFTPGTEPVPSQALLERFYHVSRSVDSTTRDSIIEIVVQANFRSPRVHCTHLVGPPTRLSLSLTRQTDTTGVNAVLLGVEYEASEALLVSGVRSLHLRLNGSELQPAQAEKPARREGFTRTEKMHYKISSDELRQIVDADTASVHLEGRAGRCDSPVTGHARGLIGLFIERELGDLSVAAKR